MVFQGDLGNVCQVDLNISEAAGHTLMTIPLTILFATVVM